MARTNEEIRILTVTDDPSAPRDLAHMLGDDSGVRTLYADTGNAVSRTFESEQVDMVMIHVDSADPALFETTLRHAREQDRFIPVLAVIDGEDAKSALSIAAHGVEGLVSHASLRQIKRLAANQVESIRARRDAKMALASLEDIEGRYTLLLDSSSEAIAYLHEGLHIYANPAYLELFGFDSFEDLEGLSMLDLFTATEEVPNLKKVLKSLARGDIPDEAMTLHAHRQDESEFSATVAFSPARYGGEYCAQMLVREKVSQTDPEMEEELRKLRTTDMLTELLNSMSFMEQLGNRLSEREDTSGLSILVMSLDNHDELIDKVGVGASDELIRQSADLFRSAVDEDAVLSRLRDHVFVLLADVDEREQAEKLATRIVEDCTGKILDVRDTTLTATVSVGLAIAGSEPPEPETLISQADSALQDAIRSGGSSFVRYRPRVSAEGDEDDAAWSERLIHAIDQDEFALVTSPITCMEDDAFLVNEVETRLRAEESDEVLLPAVYLAAASRVGLAPRLDLDMLGRLVDLINERNTESGQQWLVTLSVDTLADEKANAAINKILAESPLSPEQMIWGFREYEIREKLRQGQAFIDRFRPSGSRFALCDVAPDAAIEPVLSNLEVDFLRLSPEAVQNLGNNEKLRQQLSSLSSHAREYKVRIIAPRVEHTGDLATLWQFGITLVQGDFVREVASA